MIFDMENRNDNKDYSDKEVIYKISGKKLKISNMAVMVFIIKEGSCDRDCS